jgi:hypothetical protein
MLVANDENVKVIQELIRHASSRSTLEIYSQARTADKRAAQQGVVQMIFLEDLNRERSIGERDPDQSGVTFEWVNQEFFGSLTERFGAAARVYSAS